MSRYDWSEEWISNAYERCTPKVRLPDTTNPLVGVSIGDYYSVLEQARHDIEALMDLGSIVRRMFSEATEHFSVQAELIEASAADHLADRKHPAMKLAISAREREIAANRLAVQQYGESLVMWRKRKSDIESLSDVIRMEDRRLASVVSDCRFHITQVAKGVKLQSFNGREVGGSIKPKEPSNVIKAEVIERGGTNLKKGNDILDSYLTKMEEEESSE